MGTQPCQGCEECKTTFAGHPDHHKELQPHDWVVRYNQTTGKPCNVCKRCSAVDKESYEKAKLKD